jgi:RsiW-degrading membrane proteinase PrsW (M82 family)
MWQLRAAMPRHRVRSLRAWLFAIAIASIVFGLLAGTITKRIVPAEQRGRWASTAGNFAEAESIYWAELQRGNVNVPLVIAFLEAHDRARALQAVVDTVPDKIRRQAKMKPQPALPEPAVESFFARSDLPREAILVARLHRGGATPEVIAELGIEAAKNPPMPWANHVLGREAHHSGLLTEAADRFEREALAYDRRSDLEESLMLRLAAGDRAGVLARLDDPKIAARAPAGLSFQLAMEDRRYGRALRYLLPFAYPRPALGPVLLALVSAGAWFVFCARLGQLAMRPRFRVPLHLAAFALGALSIAPTMFLIVWQELVLHLHPDGTVVRDGAFFILGVGFREELSKLICFLPLVPILRKHGKPLDVVTSGALVGLGFAAVENLQYFTRDDLSSALGRFLTANFLHMSMTALTATAFAKIGQKDEWFHDFTVTFLTVVGLHGVYDFFLANPSVSDMSFLAMAVFVILARDFVLAMHDARLRAGRSQSLLPPFAIGMTLVCGASFVYGSAVVGPGLAAEAMFLGMLGMAVLMLVFVRQLRAL